MSKEIEVLESFMSYCDSMKVNIVEEKLDTRILDLNFGKTMKLFHGTSNKIEGYINPTSVNVGNRLSKGNMASFWTKDFDYAVFWAASWCSAKLKLREGFDINSKNIIMPGFYIWYYNDEECSIENIIKTKLDENPMYVYEANIPIKHIGRGQYAINEYTVDIPVTPEKEYKIGWNEIKDYLLFVEDENEYNKMMNKCEAYAKRNPNIREKLIFPDYHKTNTKRTKIYNKLNNKE